MGRLTATPELKTTQSGKSVTTFTLAIDRRYTQGGEKAADFINCVAWRSTAEFITKYFNKGDMIAVTGEIQTRSYEDRNKNKRTAFEVIVNEASFCGGKTNNSASSVAEVSAESYFDINDDDLPFN